MQLIKRDAHTAKRNLMNAFFAGKVRPKWHREGGIPPNQEIQCRFCLTIRERICFFEKIEKNSAVWLWGSFN